MRFSLMALPLNIFLCCNMQMDGGIFCFSSAAAQALFMPMFLRCFWFQQESLPSAKDCCWLRKKRGGKNCSPYFFLLQPGGADMSSKQVIKFAFCDFVYVMSAYWNNCFFSPRCWIWLVFVLCWTLFLIVFYLLGLLKGKGGIELFALLSNLQ